MAVMATFLLDIDGDAELWLKPVGVWEAGGVVWRNKMGEEGACWLYRPGMVLGELGQRGGREVGAQPRHWLGVVV
jgi:hypothetical protein